MLSERLVCVQAADGLSGKLGLTMIIVMSIMHKSPQGGLK